MNNHLKIVLGFLLIIGLSFSAKIDYENCSKNECNSKNVCGTDTVCQQDLNQFYQCYAKSANCNRVFHVWNQLNSTSTTPPFLNTCISDCSGNYKSQQANQYFSCLKNSCLSKGEQAYTSSNIISASLGLIAFILAIF